jgi:pentatricopeptide repeat protein
LLEDHSVIVLKYARRKYAVFNVYGHAGRFELAIKLFEQSHLCHQLQLLLRLSP